MPGNGHLVVFSAGFLLANFSWPGFLNPYLCHPFYLRKILWGTKSLVNS
jgi:hypothetical protein